jgi:hypothetical protein
MDGEQEIDIDQRISGRESLPHRRHPAKPIDDPPLVSQQPGMDLNVFNVRDLLTTRLVLDGINRMERQTGDVPPFSQAWICLTIG